MPSAPRDRTTPTSCARSGSFPSSTALASPWPATASAAGPRRTSSPPQLVAELAELVAEGRLTVPISTVYPLEQVQEAYRQV
ncbi:zinc-binding dehydrogenase [Streptomyces sp. NPDC001073]